MSETAHISLSNRLQGCHSAVIHDVMKGMGLPIRVLPRTIVGLEPWMKLAGPVFTIRGTPDASLDKDTSLFEWAGLLSTCPNDHVIICQPQDDTRALFGGLSAEALKRKGVRGYIVDGGCRDVQAIVNQRFPTFARFASPIDIASAWRADAFGDPVAVGGHRIVTDDYVLADRDGIILIAASEAEDVLSGAEAKLATEGAMEKAIRAGEDPQQAYLRFRVF